MKRSSNSDKNSRKSNILKVMMSPQWHHSGDVIGNVTI